jgi:sigma-B regulation protein RsbU (phosphoserine phosphatase)
MNRRFVAMSADHCFATAVVTTFFAPTRTLAVCNAGHPPPLWYRAKRGQWEYLELRRAKATTPASSRGAAAQKTGEPVVSNIPLGVVSVTRYQQFEVTLEPGDLVLCYTDSLIESLDPTEELLGQEGLIRIARTLDAREPSKLIASLLTAVRAEHAGNLEDDDVTALLIRPTGTGGYGSPWRRLLSPVRVVRAILVSWLGQTDDPAPLPEFSLMNIGGAWITPLNRLRRRHRSAGQ